MQNKPVPARALSAWILCAACGPLAICAAGQSWKYTLPIGLTCGLLSWCIHVTSDDIRMDRKWYVAFQWCWAAISAGTLALWSAQAWPDSEAYPAVPLILLVLAAASAWNGAQRASRVSGVLYWLLALLFSILITAGIKDIELQWTMETGKGNPEVLVFCFLIPVAATAIPRQYKGVLWSSLLGLALFGTAISLVVSGVLSAAVATQVQMPLYEYSRGVTLFGAAERFEALVCVALTMSIYSAMALILSGAGHLAESIEKGMGRKGIALCAVVSVVVVLLKCGIKPRWLAIMALIAWGILPIIAQGKKRK